MKGFKAALIFFMVMFVGDLISTILNGDLVVYLETNPIYHYVGLTGISLLNLSVAAAFYYGYKYSKSVNTRHAFLYAIVFVSFLRIFIIYNNVQSFLNPVTLEVAAAIPKAVKQAHYWTAVIQPFFLAFVPAWISFALFNRDHDIKENESFRAVQRIR